MDTRVGRIAFRVGFKILSFSPLEISAFLFWVLLETSPLVAAISRSVNSSSSLSKITLNMMSSANKHSSRKTHITDIKKKKLWTLFWSPPPKKNNYRIIRFSERKQGEKCCLLLLERQLGYLIFGPERMEDPGNTYGHFVLLTRDDDKSSSLDYW